MPYVYPEPTCMICGAYCPTFEVHNQGKEDEEMWCWCEKCETDTFHKIKYEEEKN